MSDLISRSEEKWKDIQGYEGLYQVSNLGNVRSVDRIVKHYPKDYFQKGRVLKSALTKNGYPMVILVNHNDRKTKMIHRLVAETFIPNTNNLPQVNHKDEDKINNKVDNLEWCTHKYNVNYGHRNENMSTKLGKKVAMLKDGQIVKVFNSQAEAKRNGYSQAQISKCCNVIVEHYLGYQWMFVE